jgi:hypothetical protein
MNPPLPIRIMAALPLSLMRSLGESRSDDHLSDKAPFREAVSGI